MKYFYAFTFFLFFSHQVKACSAFYATNGNNMFVGINVDWKVPESQIHFIPAIDNKFGYLKFNIKGYFDNSFGDVGGLNDHGLFYEWTDNLYPVDFTFHVPGTVTYSGYVMDLIMKTCTNVEEAEKVFRVYNAPYFSYTHLIMGDQFGNSIVIERAENDSLNFIKRQKNYQIVTNSLNSYLENPKTADFIGDYRYEFIDEMLNSNQEITVDFFQTVLNGAANKGQKNPTIFSNIYDLKSLDVHTYLYNNYEEALTFNLIEELKKGDHYVLLPQLFSGIKGIYPISSEIIANSSVNLSWYGNVAEFEIMLSTDKNFAESTSIKIGSNNYQKAGFGGLFILMTLLSFILIRKNRQFLVIAIYILIFIGGCEKDTVDLPSMVSTIKHSKMIDGLLPNNTYYWKIIASGKNGFKTESKVYNFLTSDFK